MAFNRRSAAFTAFLASAGVCVSAQTTFQFVVSATDSSGAPVTDLRTEDVVMLENGVKQQVVKVEPLAVPMKLTIAVDNGIDTPDAIDIFRTGLGGLIEALPPDVEVTLIATAPQPRTVVKPTTDREQILKGLKNFAPERAAPRFTDTLVEYSQRLQRESKDRNATPYLPVMVMVSTGTNEATTYQPKDIEKAVGALVANRAKLNVVLVSTRTGDVAAATHLKSSMQGIVSATAVRATNGRYEEVAVPARLATLLPEWGRDLATLQLRQTKQFRVTVERSRGGDLQNPRIELARPGLTGAVTRDGYLP
jgi:hypothetical protein